MQLDIREARLELRPLGLGLLHSVLAEDALPGGERFLDARDGDRLRDGDQRDARGLAAIGDGGALERGADLGEARCSVHAHPPCLGRTARAGLARRISPSCATEATSRPSRVKIEPREKPRAPPEKGKSWL